MRLLLIPVLLALLLGATSCMTAVDPEKIAAANDALLEKEGIVPLKLDDPAPAFTADTAAGERVTIGNTAPLDELEPADEQLADASAEYTVLYFYPADFTPISSKHLVELSKDLDKLAAENIKLYGVSTGTADLHTEYKRKRGISVPLLVDAGSVGTAYGVMGEGGKYPQRTLVGIRPDGTIGFYKRGFVHAKLVDLILKETGRTPEKK